MVAPFFVHAVQLPQRHPSWLPHYKGNHFPRDNQIYLVNKCLKKNIFYLGFINTKYLDISIIICTFDVGFQDTAQVTSCEAAGPLTVKEKLKFEILLQISKSYCTFANVNK